MGIPLPKFPSDQRVASKTLSPKRKSLTSYAPLSVRAEDKTLVPHVKMGVEAREQALLAREELFEGGVEALHPSLLQVVTSKGLEDKPITSKHHPLTRREAR